MKAHLLTYHFSDNYGALFQAYALREWFRRRGIEAEFVNYHPRYVEEGGAFDRWWDPRNHKKNIVIAYLKLSHFFWSIFQSRAQRRAFDDFRCNELGVNGPRLFFIKDIPAAGAGDLCVCGSDQIWNPSAQRGLDPAYFLAIEGIGRARRISYAASFGTASLPVEFHAEAGQWIRELDAVSVREESGVGIVACIADQVAVCVPDPTILLGNFRDLLTKGSEMQTGHVFCYALRSDKGIREVALHLGDKYGAPVVSPRTARQRWRPIGVQVDPGPPDWLRLLNNASVVVTNSFHGVALSLVLNRPFVAVALPGSKGALNERASNLLAQVGLSDRVVTGHNLELIDKAVARPICWDDVNARLAELRKAGEIFLEAQLAATASDAR